MPRFVFDGGLNENAEIDLSECAEGFNFALDFSDDNLRPRKPQDLKDTTPNGAAVNGIMQLITSDDTETTLVFENHSTPTIYSWTGSAFNSERTNSLVADAKLRDTFWALDDYIVITDVAKKVPVLKWDGSSCDRLLNGIAAGAAQSVSSITRSGSTATVTTSASHGYADGDLVHIDGANETDYNIEAEIAVTGSTTFTYTVGGSPSSPATGTITADFGTELRARYALVHNGRMWFFNVLTDDNSTETDTPHLMVASKYEDPTNYDTATRAGDSSFTGNEAFFMLTPDLQPINGAVVFNQEIVISTEYGRLYRLTGSDSTDYRWVPFYQGSAASGTETMTNIGNDVVYMRRGGNIESLVATATSGDVETNDLSVWIPDTTNDLSESITIYDQSRQKVYFFVTDKVLVLHKNLRRGKSPWSVYTTNMSNKFNTNAARYLRRPGESTYTVYWGDSSGQIFDMEGVGSGDAGSTDISLSRTTNPIYILNTRQNVLNGTIQYRRIGEFEFSVLADWSDEYNQTQADITLKGPPDDDVSSFWNGSTYWGGDKYWNQGFQFTNKVSSQRFDPSGRGPSVLLTFFARTSVRFNIDHIDIGNDG